MTDITPLYDELHYYRRRCAELEARNSELEARNSELEGRLAKLETENKGLREELLALKTTVSAVVARSIDAKADTGKKRYKRSGRRNGHEGASRRRPVKVDETVELDQSTCPRCGGPLSGKPTDAYTRVVEDIVPARVVVTKYVVRRRYCCTCEKQVSPLMPNVLSGGNERFGLRLMLLIASLKLLGLSYEKIGSLLKLLFGLDVTGAAMVHSVMSVSSAFGPRYDELREELRKEASLHGDETSWRIKGRNHWLWAFLGRWSVIYEVAKSRGKDVPRRVLGKDYRGIVISDSWSAWNHVGKAHQRCLVHYLREIKDTSKYKSPGEEFIPFARKFKRVLRDSIRAGEKVTSSEDRLRAKGRLEARVDELITSYSLSIEREELQEVRQALEARERYALYLP